MVALQEDLKKLTEAGIKLVAISYDPVETLKTFADRPNAREPEMKIEYPLLSDEGSKTIRAYGILNAEVTDPNNRTYGIPYPGTYLVDDKGVVAGKIFLERYQERHEIDALIELVKKLDGEVAN